MSQDHRPTRVRMTGAPTPGPMRRRTDPPPSHAVPRQPTTIVDGAPPRRRWMHLLFFAGWSFAGGVAVALIFMAGMIR